MRPMIVVLALAGLGWGCTAAPAAGPWTPIANCGGGVPSAEDIGSNSALWQCAKSDFGQSQSDYDAATKTFKSQLPTAEGPAFAARLDVWNGADQQKCTKQDSLDFGCAIAANYDRARILKKASEECASASCHVDSLPK